MTTVTHHTFLSRASKPFNLFDRIAVWVGASAAVAGLLLKLGS